MSSKKRDPARYRANVGLALFSKAGHVFVGRRVNGRGAFQWQMPQGGVDEGEEPAEAALREVTEESGYADLEILADLGRQVIPPPPVHPAFLSP